jgi:hypothetical protein
MKDPTLSWLLEPKDPSISQQALIDLLDRRKDGKDVTATTEKIPSYRPVKKVLATQTSKGIWSRRRPATLQNGPQPSGLWHFSEN